MSDYCQVYNTYPNATEDGPEVYNALDVEQSVINKTLYWYQQASNAWGQFGPVEIWFVGSKETIQELEDLWCEIRVNKDKCFDTMNDCANERFCPFCEYLEGGPQGPTSAAISTYYRTSFNYYFFLMTIGQKSTDNDATILHEYFHIYQLAHISDIDDDGRNEKMMGGTTPWFSEGGAEYMAQLLYSRIGGTAKDYLKEKMKQNFDSGIVPYLNQTTPLRDITKEFGEMTYGTGAWLIA